MQSAKEQLLSPPVQRRCTHRRHERNCVSDCVNTNQAHLFTPQPFKSRRTNCSVRTGPLEHMHSLVLSARTKQKTNKPDQPNQGQAAANPCEECSKGFGWWFHAGFTLRQCYDMLKRPLQQQEHLLVLREVMAQTGEWIGRCLLQRTCSQTLIQVTHNSV